MREGDVVAARYRVLRSAASGGMGTVYQALDLFSGANVAIKTLRIDSHREDARGRTRLLREAEALARLRHPAVVRYLDHGIGPDEQPYLVMAWVEGGETLRQRLDGTGLNPMEALGLARRLASGLAAVHVCGVVHRDLKPSNVMLAGGQLREAVLVDFGVARLSRSATELTATGDHVGTPRYMAPEQIRNPRTVDARADVFALGCILFECLTGRVCFAGDDPIQVIARILFAPIPALSTTRPELPAAFQEVLSALLARDLRARPTAADVERALEKATESLNAVAAHLPAPSCVSAPADQAADLSATRWDASDEPNPPPSFQLGPNALSAATLRTLPLHPGVFVGREDARGHLASVLRAGAPIVVVWGGPGMGKTRLVVETLRQMAAEPSPPWDALVFGDLVEARTADDVVRLLARESGISLETSAQPEIALGLAFGKLGRVLLVLDPVEHLSDLLAATVLTFARTAPSTQVLATSRRRWSVAGAASIELGPLATETSDRSASPAALLLLERSGLMAASADADPPSPPPSVVEQAERVASALEGIPTAIELSAAHVHLLGLDGLMARVRGARDARAPHPDARESDPMRRALERSWDLLNEAERSAFAQCAVFRGGFTVGAAEAVIQVPAAGPSVLQLLQSLRYSSLLCTRSVASSQEARLAMFAPMQEFAWEKVKGAQLHGALRRHAAHYAEIESWQPTETAAARLARVEIEADNLLAAAELSFADDEAAAVAGMRALVALEPAIFSRGAVAEYLELLDRAVARAERASSVGAAASFGMVVRQTRARFDAPSGRWDRARADLGTSLEDARRSHDSRREGAVLLDLGVVHHLGRALGDARRCYEAAIDRLVDVDDPATLGRCVGNVGALSHDEGRFVEASRCYREAIALLERAGETRRRANFIGNLAILEQELGHFDEASRLFGEARGLLEPLRDARVLAITLGNHGALELELGKPDRSVALFERSLALLAGSDDARSRSLCLARLAAALSRLGRSTEAELRLRHAERLAAKTDVAAREVVALARGFLEVSQAEEARAAGDAAAATRHLSAAKETVERVLRLTDQGRSLVDRSDDIRAMLRILLPLVREAEL